MSASARLLESLLGDEQTSADTAPAVVKAIAWARVSTDMQEERGLSMPEQLREIREYAEKHGIEIVGEFHEAASAFQKEAKRVEFHRMLAALRSAISPVAEPLTCTSQGSPSGARGLLVEQTRLVRNASQ
jgi:hypothetical protein